MFYIDGKFQVKKKIEGLKIVFHHLGIDAVNRATNESRSITAKIILHDPASERHHYLLSF